MEQDDKLQISFIGLEEKCKAFEAKYWEQVVKTDETASNHAHLQHDYKVMEDAVLTQQKHNC